MGLDLATLKARCRASLASRARISADFVPRATTNVNTGVSAKRTTVEAELGTADALSAGVAEAPSCGATLALGAGIDDAVGSAIGVGAAIGVGTAIGVGVGSGSGRGWAADADPGTGIGESAEAEAEAAAEAEATGNCAAAAGDALPEALADASAEAVAGADCAQSCAGLSSPMANHRHRNRSPQTRVELDELSEDLTLGVRASVTGFTTASTIPHEKSATECPHRPLEPVAKVRRQGYFTPANDDD
jgi:hypothetical protein